MEKKMYNLNSIGIGQRKNLLLLIDKYLTGSGASVAAKAYVLQWSKDELGDAFIYTTSVETDDVELKDILYNLKDDLCQLINEKNIDIIHYFHSSRSPIRRSLLFDVRRALRNVHKYIPIVTTVCQRPSNKITVLTTEDIKLSDHIVFIDNAAYNDKLYAFIPINRKSRIYFGVSQAGFDILATYIGKNNNGQQFVFGRGSTLNKCPKDILDIFEKINVPNKRYEIAGVDPDSWLGMLAKDREDVRIIPPRPYGEWLDICSKFNVFLYYLPEDAHSSIDGTLSDAMLMQIPPIVYGADAPKERIIQGVNGFIANSKEEIVKYAELLYYDAELRKKMGESARKTQMEMFSFEETLRLYNEIYDMLLKKREREKPISIPFKDRIKIFKQKYMFAYWGIFFRGVKTKIAPYFYRIVWTTK